MAPRKGSKGKQVEWERRRKEDAVMAILAQALLDEPGLRVKPEMRDAMLRRFLDLLAKEQARRSANRPPELTGQLVANLAEACGSEKRAIALAAKIKKSNPESVTRRYREYKAQQRGGK